MLTPQLPGPGKVPTSAPVPPADQDAGARPGAAPYTRGDAPSALHDAAGPRVPARDRCVRSRACTTPGRAGGQGRSCSYAAAQTIANDCARQVSEQIERLVMFLKGDEGPETADETGEVIGESIEPSVAGVDQSDDEDNRIEEV